MSAKGRAKCPKKQLPSLLGQALLRGFGERSEPGKPKVFRVSARESRMASRESRMSGHCGHLSGHRVHSSVP